MNIFNFKTTMSGSPTSLPVCMDDQSYITRAATAVLTFSFDDKIYDFEDLDQFIYILNQGGKTTSYQLFTYIYKTLDTTVIPGKLYYSDVFSINNTNQHYGLLVTNPSGNPKEKGYYEVIEAKGSGWRDLPYIVDRHYTLEMGENYCTLSLILSPEETRQFKAGSCIDCEVMIRLNTEKTGTFGGTDAVLLEPQPKIFVEDSLYSKLK